MVIGRRKAYGAAEPARSITSPTIPVLSSPGSREPGVHDGKRKKGRRRGRRRLDSFPERHGPGDWVGLGYKKVPVPVGASVRGSSAVEEGKVPEEQGGISGDGTLGCFVFLRAGESSRGGGPWLPRCLRSDEHTPVRHTSDQGGWEIASRPGCADCRGVCGRVRFEVWP